MQATGPSIKLARHSCTGSVRGTFYVSVKTAHSRPSQLRSASADADTTATPVAYTSNGNGASSPTASTTTAAPAPPTATATDTITATKLALLEQVAALDRGTLATHADKENIQRLVKLLEQAGSPANPFAGAPAPVEGRWELLYTNKEVFRASPFFLAFQNGLVQNKELSEAIFKFTDAIPGAEIGTAYQTISLLSGSLVSEVQMTVFPGFTGTVVTSSRVALQPGNQLGLTIESTRVADSTFSPLLDNVAVPVEQLINQVRGEGSTSVVYDITYVDSTLRVTRAGDQLMVHRRTW